MIKIISYIFLCIAWGTTWIAIKITLEGMPPFYGAAARFIIAIVLLFLFAKFKRVDLSFSKKYFIVVGISAFLMYVFDYGLIYWGEQYLSAGVTSIFFATFSIFTVMWANFLFKSDRFRWNIFVGIMLGFIGILIVFFNQLVQTQFNNMVIMGSVAIIIGAAGGAMAVVIIKKYASTANPVAITLHQMVLGVGYLILLGLMFEDYSAIELNKRIVGAVLYLGLFGSAIAFTIYYWLLKNWSAITLSTIIYITPVVAIIFDYIILGETISPRSIVGAIVIFSGIATSQLHQWNNFMKKKKYLPERIL
jgi:drug/metabolite transporter (DMT)-like permease